MTHGEEVKRKLANAVGSQYPSHYLGTWCIQHYYRRCAHLGCQQSTELTPPGRFKWTRPFRRKRKSGFYACVITFQLDSNEVVPLRVAILTNSSLWRGNDKVHSTVQPNFNVKLLLLGDMNAVERSTIGK